jgi:hypothetical protein
MSSAPEVPPLVSVVMPCYNAEAYVAEAIRSVVTQTYPRVELVVVDDASTDGSWAVVQGLAAEFPDRVRALRMPENRGGCHARNRGAEASGGDYLMFLDADDAISHDAIAALVETLRANPESVGACPWQHLERVNGKWLETAASLPLPEAGADLFRVWLEGSAWAPTSAVCWPRAVYERTGGWDEELTREQDDDIMLRAYAQGALLAIAGRGLACYRLHEPLSISVTKGIGVDKLRSSVRLLEKMVPELERRGRMDELGPLVGNVYHQLALKGFQQGHVELARECQRRGEALAGPAVLSPTRAGRLLVRVLGLEGKERLVQAMARLGIATAGRRRAASARRAFTPVENAPKPDDSGAPR